MKKISKFSFLFILGIAVSLFVSNSVMAYEVSSEDSDIKVDKFQPSSGVKIKSSRFAQAMENATYNATHKDGEKKDTSITDPDENSTPDVQKKKRDTSTFRWF